jgi:hypothetical protein
MKYEPLKQLQDYYLDTMRYDNTFIRFLSVVLEGDETLKKIGLSKHELKQLIKDLKKSK